MRSLLTTAVVAALILVTRSSFADHYVVPSGSMEPTVLTGDRVVVDKQAYGLRMPLSDLWLTGPTMPRRGEVVVFISPHDGALLLKRVAAIAGDRVAVRAGRVRLGAAADDPTVGGPGDSSSLAEGPDFGPTTIAPGELLLLGDNRGNSHDSRFFGPVAAKALRGRVRAVYARDGALTWRPL